MMKSSPLEERASRRTGRGAGRPERDWNARRGAAAYAVGGAARRAPLRSPPPSAVGATAAAAVSGVDSNTN